MNQLFLLAINLTRRCNLACAHCYLDAATLQHGTEEELTSAEVCRLLDEIAARSTETMVVLTGGEPLLRSDLEQILAHGSALGLAMVVGTNGLLLTEPRVRSLKAAGTMGLGISLDFLDPEYHDNFRGRPGSWRRALAGMEACRRHRLPFQIHFSVTRENAGQLPAMIRFTRSVGARVLNIFFLVCTGRGETMSDISPQRYEQLLRQIAEAQEEHPDIMIRARCAPHYKRIIHQRDPRSPLTLAEGYEGGGCLAGRHYCRITPEGTVTACPYIETGADNIRERGFLEIWDHAPLFRQLRRPRLRGRCGECEYRLLCGGCRARPLAAGGGLMDSDPWCAYTPGGGAPILPLQPAAESSIEWSPEAERRLARVPPFLRKMVRKRAMEHVRRQGGSVVTGKHLTQLAAGRFKEQPATDGAAEELPWTAEARSRLAALPPFLQGALRRAAEEAARSEGRLEVNTRLLERLEGQEEPSRRMGWEPEAERLLNEALERRSPPVRLFLRPSLEMAAEREAARRGAATVTAQDMRRVLDTDTAGVEWEPEALRRVESAPEFIRAGIKKAAEW
ncbi:MAG TPA: radical SAM protein, partial [Gammaproteobacteria bacterium]|nr:radical SAM protein [Gammaproteobacteria bacterium]